MNRYFVGFLVTVGLVILLIVLIFSGGSSSKQSQPRKLPPYATTDAKVIMTIDGPVNAPQNHQSVKITVDNTSTTFEKLVGYDGQTTQVQTFPNTVNSYTVFLRSLARMGYLSGNDDPAFQNASGYCPTDNTYVFDLVQDGKTITHYWATACGGVKTYLGNLSGTVNLFQAQVPGYDDLTGDLTNL